MGPIVVKVVKNDRGQRELDTFSAILHLVIRITMDINLCKLVHFRQMGDQEKCYNDQLYAGLIGDSTHFFTDYSLGKFS